MRRHAPDPDYYPKTMDFSLAEYYKLEAYSDVKHEYLGGELEAMAGAPEEHEIVAGNIFAALLFQLRGGPCRAFKSDMKLHVQQAEQTFVFYPDVMVVCDPTDSHRLHKERPKLLVEVTSKDWQRDYHLKLEAYLPIPSLEEYVVIKPDKESPQVSIYLPAHGTNPVEVITAGPFTLTSVGLTMTVEDLFV